MSTRALIANGTAVSGEVDLRGLRLTGILFPAAWTAADLSIQIADVSGGPYGEVFIDPGNGTGVALATDAAASQCTLFSPRLIANCFIKLRSGPVGGPVNQGADRTLILLTEPSAK